jgi:hypothetical protein
VAQEKVTALEAKARQDAAMAEWLHKERDDSCQTERGFTGSVMGPTKNAMAPSNGSAPSIATSRGRKSKSWRPRVSQPGLPRI